MSENFRLPVERLDEWADDFHKDREAQMIANAIKSSGLQPNFLQYDEKKNPFTFSVDINFDDVCDQGESGRCWGFSTLNALRWNVKRKLNIDDSHFELSQNYLYFYDQLEKAWDFLNRIRKNASAGIDNPKIQKMLAFPIEDNGQAHRAVLLCEKYGVVPKYAMPDTECSKNTKPVTKILGMKLIYGANALLKAAADGESEEKSDKIQIETLEGVVKILYRFLGEPPKKFNLEYRDTAGKYHNEQDINPVQFYLDYAKRGEYVTLIHHPSDKLPFNQAYVYDFFEEGERTGPQTLINLDMEDFKRIVINQLKNGDAAVLGADVRQQNSRELGYMDENLYDYEAIFDTELKLSKRERIQLKALKGTHIMTFTGVNIGADGKPDRWKVQNSYGKEKGINGFYLMTDAWFTEYVVSTLVNREVFPNDLAYLLNQEPIPVSKGEFY